MEPISSRQSAHHISKRNVPVFAVASVACLTLFWTASMFLAVRTASTLPQRPFALADLFIEESAFPQSLHVNASGPARICIAAPLGSGCYSAEAQGVTFSFPVGLAAEDIHRYASSEAAAADFSRLRYEEFAGLTNTEWRTPPAVRFESPSAAQSYVACTIDRNVERCQLLAQYAEFNVLFRMDMIDSDYHQFVALIHTVDERIRSFLIK